MKKLPNKILNARRNKNFPKPPGISMVIHGKWVQESIIGLLGRVDA